MKTTRPFADPSADFFAVSNLLFDDIMPQVSPTEFKVLCYLIRQTRGWRRSACRVTYTQVRDGTGIGSDATVCRDLKSLVERGFVIAHKGCPWAPTEYRLNAEYEVTHTEGPTTETVTLTLSVNKEPTTETVALPTTETVALEVTLTEEPTTETVVPTSKTVVLSATENEVPSLLIKNMVKNKPTTRTRARDGASRLVAGEYPPEFERFWSAWPAHERKRQKRDALKAWMDLHPPPELVDQIVDAVEAQKSGSNWCREHGRWIPLPGTWLRRGGWDDEVIPWSAARDYYDTPHGQRSMDVVEDIQRNGFSGFHRRPSHAAGR